MYYVINMNICALITIIFVNIIIVTYVYVCRADSTHTVSRHEILACVGRGT